MEGEVYRPLRSTGVNPGKTHRCCIIQFNTAGIFIRILMLTERNEVALQPSSHNALALFNIFIYGMSVWG